MKLLKIAGLALASMLVAGMALAGNAAAGPLWLLCLEGNNPNLTKYEDNQCQHVNQAHGTWESQAISNRSDTVRLQAFTIELTDTKATGGVSTVRCGHPTVGWGLIFNTNLLLTKVAKVENPKTECARVSGGCKAGEVEVVEGINLPWKSELFETEGLKLAKILKDGASGEPGWKVECNTLLGKQVDECTSETGKPAEETEGNNETVGGVLLVRAIFRNRSKGKCTQGGTGAAELHGLIAILLWTGLGLSINSV